MRKPRDKRYLGLVLPVLILLLMISRPYMTVMLGDEILLETVPVDPTDIFRGDYVQLSYKISELDTSYIRDAGDETYFEETMYALLKPEGELYTVDYLTREKPASGIYLKCFVRTIEFYAIDFKPTKVQVDYRINRFYLKEGTGLALENAAREGTLLGKVKVYKGTGVLTDILMEE